jgi:hypothetical protein
MAERRYTAKKLAEAIGFTKEYLRLLLGEYQEKNRPPSISVLARLQEVGFEWTPPQAQGEGGMSSTGEQAAQRSNAKADSKKRRKSRTPSCLVERDRAVVLFLARAELATREQIQTLFFPSEATAARRLRQLTDAKTLRRYRPPAATGGPLAGSAQWLYGLGARGAELASDALGRPVRELLRSGRAPNTLFLEHRLEVTQFFVHLVLAAADRLVDWATGAALEDQVRVGQQQRRFAPDGYLALRLEDGSLRHALVEVDRGTMGPQAWQAKARVYQAYYRTGGYTRRYGTERLLLLVVVPDAQQQAFIRRIMQTIRPVVMCFVATRPDIETHTATGPAWLRYDTGERCDLWTTPNKEANK